MFKFITDALSELEHVVWPTPHETQKYMTYTVWVIVTLGVFLAILGYGIREGLTFTRAQFPHNTSVTPTVSGEDLMTQDDLKALTEQITQIQSSGATLSTWSVQTGQTR